MKKIILILAALWSSLSSADPFDWDYEYKPKPEISKAIDAALNGPILWRTKILGHKFNVRRAYVDESDGSVIITGQISYVIPVFPDHELFYQYVFKDNTLISYHIYGKGFGIFVRESGKVEKLEKFVGETFTPEALPIFYGILETQPSSEWKVSAVRLSLRIAIEGLSRTSGFGKY